MARNHRSVVILCLMFAGLAAARQARSEHYFSLDSTVSVVVSNDRLTIQLDSTEVAPLMSTFFADHPCLNSSVPVEDVGRGFQIYGLSPGFDFDSASVDLMSDPVVNRCFPVYVTVDSMEIPVSDVISIEFYQDVTVGAAMTILADFGLHFLDSSEFRHMLWHVALDDSILTSPLDYANALHVLDEVEWSTPLMHVRPVLFGPTDPYYPYQYYLNNTGQTGGLSDADIDADSAWMITLSDSGIIVAVIDVGGEAHADLRGDALSLGRDFFDNDSDPWPNQNDNHGMACAGILAALHNGVGIVGVHGGCHIVHIRIGREDPQEMADPPDIASAILYASSIGAKVASNSWGYRFAAPVTEVENAVRDVSQRCVPGVPTAPGMVLVFAAGNGGKTDPVHFPGNMPEVIAVGAIDKLNVRWHYSSTGLALDIMAPSGALDLQGDQWTIDREGNFGWNPLLTGVSGNGRDIGVPLDYTSAMGGTSGACPQVAGIAALLLSRRPDLASCSTAATIRNILINTVDDLGGPGRDNDFGYGRANAHKALVSVSRGDVNGDAEYDILDVIELVNQAFRNALPLSLLSDVNCDEIIDILDVTRIVNIAFRNEQLPEPCYNF